MKNKKIKNFKDYQKLAIATAIYPNLGNNITYPVLGLVGETSELYDKIHNTFKDKSFCIDAEIIKDIKKEIGDVFWYISAICHELRMHLDIDKEMEKNSEVIGDCHKEFMSYMIMNSGRIAEICKKMIRDDKGVLTEQRKDMFICQINYLVRNLYVVTKCLGINVIEVLQMNIDKLYSRKDRGKLQGDGDNR